MAKILRSWVMFAALVVCLLVCWSGFADAYPPKPERPDSNASPEEWAKYHTAVRHYINLITRQRSVQKIRAETLFKRFFCPYFECFYFMKMKKNKK